MLISEGLAKVQCKSLFMLYIACQYDKIRTLTLRNDHLMKSSNDFDTLLRYIKTFQSGGYQLIHYQTVWTNIIKIVLQTVRKIINECKGY